MKAIIISGFEKSRARKNNKKKNRLMPSLTPDFIDDAKRFARYLILKAGLQIDDVFVFKPSTIKTMGVWGMFECFKNEVDLYPNEPLIIYYSGHGEKGYWNLRANDKKGERRYFFKFKRLLRVLQKRNAPLIVIADCCYGMSLKKELKKLNYPWLLLGLAPENRVGYGTIERQIEFFWLRHKRALLRYDNDIRLVSSIRFKSYNKKFYGFKYSDGKHLKKFYFLYSYKRVKVVLRAGSDLDHLMFPKK